MGSELCNLFLTSGHDAPSMLHQLLASFLPTLQIMLQTDARYAAVSQNRTCANVDPTEHSVPCQQSC